MPIWLLAVVLRTDGRADVLEAIGVRGTGTAGRQPTALGSRRAFLQTPWHRTIISAAPGTLPAARAGCAMRPAFR